MICLDKSLQTGMPKIEILPKTEKKPLQKLQEEIAREKDPLQEFFKEMAQPEPVKGKRKLNADEQAGDLGNESHPDEDLVNAQE